MDRRHRVVQVRQMDRTRVQHGAGLFVARVRVRDGDRGQLGCFCCKINRARKFRRNVDDPHETSAAVIQLLERFKIRIPEVRAVLSALFLLGEKRSFHVDSHQPRAAGRRFIVQTFARLESFCQRFIGQRHASRRKRRYAGCSQIGRHGFQPFVVAVGKVRIHAAVGVHIHQTRDDTLPIQIDLILVGRQIGISQRHELAVEHLEITYLEVPIYINHCVSVNHDISPPPLRRKHLRLMASLPPEGWLPLPTARPFSSSRPGALR